MNQACQSASTLDELLSEAALCASCVIGPLATDLSLRLEALRAALSASPVVSAQLEHEIVSLWERARIELARSARAHP